MENTALNEIKNRIASLQNRQNIANRIIHLCKSELWRKKKELAILEYGKLNETIKFTASNGSICEGKIVDFQDSFFNDIPICILEVPGEFVTYKTHLGNGKSIIR